MRRPGGKQRPWRSVCVLAALVSCADHTEEDARACANWACTAGECQAGPSGAQCVCGAVEQALAMSCELIPGDSGEDDDPAHALPVSVGLAVNGDIGVPTSGRSQDTDVFRFDPTPGRVYLVEGTSDIAVSLELLDDAGQTVTERQGTAVRIGSPLGGPHAYVRVRAVDASQIGHYTFTVTDFGPSNAEVTLEPGVPGATRILAPSEKGNRLALDVQPGGIYTFDCTFDAPLRGDATLDPFGFVPPFRAEAGQAYGLVVRGDTVGTYRCTLSRLPDDDAGDTPADARPIPANGTFHGRGDVRGDLDYFSIAARRGTYLWAHAEPPCLPDFIAPDDGSPTLVNGLEGWAFVSPSADETVYLAVGCGLEVTSYDLTTSELADAEADDASGASPIGLGVITGRMEGPGDEDVFRFQAVGQHTYAIPYAYRVGWFAEGAGVRSKAVDSTTIFTREDDGPVFLRRTWGFPYSPKPFVYSDPLTDLALSDPEPGTAAAAVPSAIGATIAGTLQSNVDRDCFAFQVPAGVEEFVEVHVPPSAYAVLFFIVTPDGTAGYQQFDNASIPAGAGGRFVVCVEAQATLLSFEQMDYTVRVHP